MLGERPDECRRLGPSAATFWSTLGEVREGDRRATTKRSAINPDHIEALNNRGCLLGDMGRTGRSARRLMSAFSRSIRAMPRPGSIAATCWSSLHREEEAIESYRQAHALKSNKPEARYNEASTNCALATSGVGWENYELRWFIADYVHTQRKYPLPRWNGEPIDGPLLVSGEQGLGDQILLCEHAPRSQRSRAAGYRRGRTAARSAFRPIIPRHQCR